MFQLPVINCGHIRNFIPKLLKLGLLFYTMQLFQARRVRVEAYPVKYTPDLVRWIDVFDVDLL